MKNNNIEMRVLIKGKSITEYAHNGQLYIEGRHGSNFEIELINHNAFSVEAIVSVDGLSVIDGKDAGPNSSGYLLKAYETIRIPGWKLNDQSVAAFQFAGGKGSSYAEQSTGSGRNKGVIGVLAYQEKPKPYNTILRGGSSFIGAAGPTGATGPSGVSGHGYHVSTLMADPMIGHTLCGTLCGGSGPIDKAMFYNGQPVQTINLACTASSLSNHAQVADCMQQSITTLSATVGHNSVSISAAAAVQPQNNLGTAFGQAQDFQTETTTFDRGDLLCMSVVRYDDKRGLTARGIVLERRPAKRRVEEASAFPAMNCQPPAGWKG